MMRFAISGVFTKENGNGKINIQNKLMEVHADSKGEAVGIFVNDAFKQFPEHSLFMYPCVIILDDCEAA